MNIRYPFIGKLGRLPLAVPRGERNSHIWFALRYLLGFEKVCSYHGSWG